MSPHNPYAPPAAATSAQLGGGAGAYQDERRSVLLMVVLSVVTLGVYPAVWFLRRRRFVDSLDSTQKLGHLAAAPLIATVVSVGVSFAGIPPELDRAVTMGLTAVSVLAAFRVAHILRSDFARTGRFLKVSGAATFFFNALYLQYKINQAADTPRGAASPPGGAGI